MTLKTKIGSAIAAAGLIASTLAPAVSAQTIDISGNGNGSDNTVTVTNTCVSSLIQKNITRVNTDAVVVASTGNNEANGNVGSGVTIDTGNAGATLDISVEGSTNTGEMPSCCECAATPADVTISGNGNNSTNTVTDTNTNVTTAKQKNKTRVKTTAKVKAKTGKNKAKNNVGGNVGITTGEATSSATITVGASSNSL